MSRMRIAVVAGITLPLGLWSAVTGAQQQPNGQPPFERPVVPLSVHPLKGDVCWAKGPSTSNNSNNGFIVGRNGVFLFDTKNTVEDQQALLAEIARVTDKPVTHVLLSHGDGDHVNGLAALPRGITIIAHEDTRRFMQESAAKGGRAAILADYLPTRTFTTRDTLMIDGVPVDIYHFAPAHTGGDLVMHLPQQKIVFMGDIVISEIPEPFMHMNNGGSPLGVIKSIRGMIALDADSYVSGHGDVIDKAELQRRLVRYEAKAVTVRALVAQGKSLADIKAALGETAAPATPGSRGPRPGLTDFLYQELTRR